MNISLTFPGQGSQKVGMGQELAQQSPDAKRVFDEVDDALGIKLSQIVWHGTEDELTKTENAQPALMATSLAVFNTLKNSGFDFGKVAFVAGHSLGEYSALAAAGAISIADAAKLLRIRGQAMQQAVPVGKGAMAAILGLEESQIQEICNSISNENSICQIANDNGGGQWVISGHKQAIDGAIERAGEAGAKRAIPLSVSAPFHSQLMQSAAEKMEEALGGVEISKPQVPLVCNVTAQAISEPDEIKQRLVEQVTGRVRWRETISYMASNGVKQALELGSGKVLTGLAKRIAKEIEPISLETLQSIKDYTNV